MKLRGTSNRQITLYYDSTSKLGKQALADAKSSRAEVQDIDILNTKVSGTEWAKIADALNLDVLDLINQDHAVYKNLYGSEKVDLDTTDAIKILEKHPETLVYPIAIRGNYAVQIKQSTDMRKLKNPDSQGTNLE